MYNTKKKYKILVVSSKDSMFNWRTLGFGLFFGVADVIALSIT
jgi:hypothetical protein